MRGVREEPAAAGGGCVGFSGIIQQPGDARPRYLRVVTLADGETVREDER
jgi:hypothetical protein